MSAWQRVRTDLIVIGSAIAFLVATGVVVYRVSGDDAGIVLADAARMEFGFEGGEGDDRAPAGWFSGGQEGGYQVRAVEDRVRSGQWAAKIALIGERGYESFGVITQCIDSAPFAGTRVRYHGFIATEDVDASEVGLWLRADAEDGETLGFDNMGNRPLRGTSGFTEHDVVLDIPASSVELCFGALLAGAGTLWADDLVLETVAPIGQGPDVTATQLSELTNGSFEDGTWAVSWPRHWDADRGDPAYLASVVEDSSRAGTAVARVRHVRDMRDDQAGTLEQCIDDSAALEGRTVTVTAWTRTHEVTGRAVVRLTANRGDSDEPLVEVTRPDEGLVGTTPWQRHELTHDIPTDAHEVCVAVVLTGHGAVDLDDVTLEVHP